MALAVANIQNKNLFTCGDEYVIFADVWPIATDNPKQLKRELLREVKFFDSKGNTGPDSALKLGRYEDGVFIHQIGEFFTQHGRILTDDELYYANKRWLCGLC